MLRGTILKFNTAIPSNVAVERLLSIGRDILRANRVGEPPYQRPTFRMGCSWRGTTIISRQWRSHNECIRYAIRI